MLVRQVLTNLIEILGNGTKDSEKRKRNGKLGKWRTTFHKIIYLRMKRPRNNKLEKVYERVDTLASKERTENEAWIVKCFVKENWARFPSDYENTSRNQRYSSGKVENELFNHIAGLCKWKTNMEYMKIANQIMIYCGYDSYKKNKNRFKQKIENNKKKNKMRIKMRNMTIIRIIIRTNIRNINEKERKRLQLIKRSNSEEKRTIVFSNKDGSDQQMMNQDDNNHSENDTDENVVGRDDQLHNNQHSNINNNENPLPQLTDNPSENNTDNEQIREQENSVNNNEQMWDILCPDSLDLSALRNPVKPTYQHDQYDNIIF